MSLFLSAAVITILILVLGVVIRPNVERSISTMFFGFIGIYVIVFALIASIGMFYVRSKEFFTTGTQGKVVIVFSLLIALAYVVPKMIANFKK